MLVTKSEFKLEKILKRTEYGVYNIEIQLLKDFIDDVESVFKEFDIIEKYVTNIRKETGHNKFKIVNIHLPLIPDTEDGNTNISMIDDLKFALMFNNCCKLANLIGNLFNNEITIVVHNDLSLNQLKHLPTIYFKIKDILRTNLIRYDNINFSFENVTPFNIIENKIVSSNNFLFDNIEIVEDLISEDRVTFENKLFTTLDICHALISIRTVNYLRVYDSRFSNKDYNLEEFFKKNSKYCNNIHLNNAILFGIAENHSTIFDIHNDSDAKLLRHILYLHFKYMETTKITIEVSEKDYMDLQNLSKMIKALKETGYTDFDKNS